MTTTAAAAENLARHPVAGKQVVEKKEEKVEKRRALGRGLESLLPGPRVVVSPESRVPSGERGADGAAPPGLRPPSSLAGSGPAEAVPFPTSVGAVSGRDAIEKPVPHVVRNDQEHRDPSDEALAAQELELKRAAVTAPPERMSQPSAAHPSGQPKAAAVPRLEAGEARGVISIQTVAEGRSPANLVAQIAIELIDKNPYQTRYVFDEEMLLELAASIKEHGVVQPVVVRPAEEEGRYTLVLGERRLRASKMAGKETIPAMVRRVSPQQAAEMTVLENMVREDLNPIEQAEAFRVLSLEFKLTQAQIADRIGVSRETVSNYMRLLRLPQKVMEYMLAERLSFSDAREILRLENEEHIEQVAEEVVTHKLKWDQIEERVMRMNGSFPMLPGGTSPAEARKTSGARWMDPNVRAAQTDMERTLGMRVRIKDRQGKGKIVIEYASVDDYERVTEILRGNKK
jgi:ParB family chromosome partitioning protein